MFKPCVQTHETDGVFVAEFWDCPRLDLTPVQELRTRYEARLAEGGDPALVIDLGGVAFAGSMALGGFLKLHRVANARGGRVIFCRVDPNVREVFKISHVEHLFHFVGEVADALAVAKQQPGTGRPDSASKVEGPLSRLTRRNGNGQGDAAP